MKKGRSMRWVWGFLSLAAGLLTGSAQEADPAANPLRADLDRDGRQERIALEKIATTAEEGDFYQVRVFDDDGSLIWEGPRVMDPENPFVFGSWHFGISLPEIAADIDGDGAVELVAPAPMSDVSPTSFRVLRWTGDRFVEVRSGSLLESPAGSGRFPWQRNGEWTGIWISEFRSMRPDGFLQVGVYEYRGGMDVKTGEALVESVADGFRLRRWTRPLAASVEAPVGEPGIGGGAMPPGGGGGPVVYRAVLGPGDHFNSSGVRLTTVADVIRQDRANFHAGKGDAGDGGDPIFATRRARDSMERRRVIPVGGNEAAWGRTILNGLPLVEVEVTSDALKVKIIRP